MALSPKSAGKPSPAILIGRVVRPHGVRGELRIEPLTDFPERFETLEKVYIDLPTGGRWWQVDGCRYVNDGVLLSLDGLDNPEDGALLRGGRLLLPRSEAMPLDEDTFYVDDLKGLAVETTDGQSVGKVREVHAGAQDLLDVRTSTGLDVLVPLVKAWVPTIDMAARRIVVANWEQLLPESGNTDEAAQPD